MISERQWADWLIAYGIEPWGTRRWVHQRQPKDAEEYRRKAMHAWANASGGLELAG